MERSTFKYQQRAYRYYYLEAGHTLIKTFRWPLKSLVWDVVWLLLFFDEEINSLLEIDGKHETVVYLGVAGEKKALKW